MNRWFFWNKTLLFCLILTVVLVTLIGTGIWAAINTAPSRTSNPGTVDSSTVPNQVPSGANRRVNILILGLDDGDFDNPDSPRRSDTLIVASIDPETKTVNLLSIPRDSRVIIPGHQGYDKIAHAFFYGGPRLAVRTVESFLNAPPSLIM